MDTNPSEYFIQVHSLDENNEVPEQSGTSSNIIPEVFEQTEYNTIETEDIDQEYSEKSCEPVENAFAVDADTVVVINGVECVLRQDPESGQLMAVPCVKEGEEDGEQRCEKLDDCDLVQQRVIQSDESTAAEGLLGLQNIGNDGVKRSCRLKRKSKKFWLVQNSEKIDKREESDDVQEDFPTDVKIEVIDDSLSTDLNEPEITRVKSTSSDLRKPKLTPLAVQNYLAGLGIPVKRGRGRPRKSMPSENILPPMITTDDGKTFLIAPNQNSNETNTAEAMSEKDSVKINYNGVEIEAEPLNKTLTDDEKFDKQPMIGLKTDASQLTKLKCPKCDFQAFYTQHYQQHIMTHEADTFKCKCCAFLCFDKDDLDNHFKETHPKNYCTVCGLQVEFAYIMKRHMQRHDPNGIVCDICKKSYKDQYILKMHIKMVHEAPEEHFSCSTCDRKFTRKAHLKRHERTHAAVKRYKCSHCDYRGSERSDISKHAVVHQEPKYKCQSCGKLFRHMKNKELHEKRHRGQRDYKCGMCDFFGYTFTDIRKHIERKHADKTFICNKCARSFRSQFALQHHLERGCEEQGLSLGAVAPDEITPTRIIDGEQEITDGNDNPNNTLDVTQFTSLEETHAAAEMASDLVMAT